MTKFKDMLLLYEEQLRREVEHYCLCNPRLQNAMQAAMWEHAPKKVKETFELIYGKQEFIDFIKEYGKRREALGGS